MLVLLVVGVQRPRPINDYRLYHSPTYHQPAKIDLAQYVTNDESTKDQPFLNKFLNAPELRAQIELQDPGPNPGLCPVTMTEGNSAPVSTLIDNALALSGVPLGSGYDLFLASGVKLDKHKTLDEQRVARGAELFVKSATTPASLLDPIVGKPGCNPFVQGAKECGTDEMETNLLTKMLWRTSVVMGIFLTLVLTIAATLQAAVRLLVRRLTRFEDKYMTELIENAFRQIAIVAVSLALLHVIESFVENGLGVTLFDVFFETSGGAAHLYLVFNAARSYVENFTLIYVGFVILFAIFAHRNFRRLRKAEEMQVEQIIVNSPKPFYLSYLAARFEYIEWMKSREIASLDPHNFWFMEYQRACLISVCSELIRLPVSALLFLQILIWFILPLSMVFGVKSVIVSLSLLSIPSFMLLAILIRAKQIKRMLLPSDLIKFIQVKHQMTQSDLSARDSVASFKEAISRNQPRYKDRPDPKGLKKYGMLEHFLYGTRYPNKHEALFFFWRRGPSLMIRLSEFGFLSAMGIIAFIGRESVAKAELWWDVWLSWPIIVVVGLLGCLCGLLPSLISDLTFISSTNMMIKENIWLDVVITSRAQFVKRLTLLTDGLKSEIYLSSLANDTSTVWKGLRDSTADVPVEVKMQRDQFWHQLTGTGRLNSSTLFKFFKDKGFNLADEESAQVWINVFHGKGGDNTGDEILTRTEFDMMVTVLTEILKEQLEDTDVKDLLQSWQIPINQDVTVETMRVVLSKLKLKWTMSQIIHFITFAAKDSNARTLSFPRFLEALVEIDHSTLGTLNVAVRKLKDVNEPQRFFAEEPELL